MSVMRKPNPIAILCSDLHLTLLKPAFRDDQDWVATQINYLGQLKVLAAPQDLPIICAGDLFDRWKVEPELIHLALRHFPHRRMFCVPGQHDLPNHRIDQTHRSGYGVLVEASSIQDIAGKVESVSVTKGLATSVRLVLHGFGWGQEITPLSMKERADRHIHIAVIHQYCWSSKATSYPGAAPEQKVATFKKALKGYDAAVFGDNHKGFVAKCGECNVINTGGFIRRKSDEVDYKPTVGILMSDGTIVQHFLNTTMDRFHSKVEKREEVAVNMKEFIDGLEGLGEDGLNFKEAVENHLRTDDVENTVKEIVLQAMEL